MQARAIAALIGVALLFGAGWTVRGYIADSEISALQSKYDRAAADASEKARLAERDWRERVAVIDEQHTKELQNAKAANDALRADLASGNKRVLVRASCPASGGLPASAPAASVDDGAGLAQLDPTVAESMVGVTDDGDEQIRKLTALQQYVREVCLAQ